MLVDATSQFNKDFMKKAYEKDNDIATFLEIDIQCLEQLRQFQIELPFLPETMKIWEAEKLAA